MRDCRGIATRAQAHQQVQHADAGAAHEEQRQEPAGAHGRIQRSGVLARHPKAQRGQRPHAGQAAADVQQRYRQRLAGCAMRGSPLGSGVLTSSPPGRRGTSARERGLEPARLYLAHKARCCLPRDRPASPFRSSARIASEVVTQQMVCTTATGGTVSGRPGLG